MLTKPQTLILQAVVDRIIPADDFLSAWQAGAQEYFVRLFRREPHFLPIYQAGLEALDTEALMSAGASFAALGAEAQDTLLHQLEAGAETVAFFRLLVEQTLESFYADPGNGGNRNGVSWDMIGYKVTA